MRLLLLLGWCLGWAGMAHAQAPPPAYKLVGNELWLPVPISFRPGTAELMAASEPALLHIKQYLDAKTYISLLRVEGHVAGSAAAQPLSEKRAAAVAAWLVAHGVDCHRLLPVGFGSTKPLAADAEANTRLVVANAALRGHLIGGVPADGGGKVAGDPCQP